MSDVLVITAPVPRQYATFNTMWATSKRGGKKSDAYTELFRSVHHAAEAEMARTGWETADYYCAVSVTVYRPTRRELDCSNAAKAELDALSAAKVWVDDRLARPYDVDTEYDPNGESRVLIVVRRRFPDLHAAPVAIARPKVAKPALSAPKPKAVQSRERMGEINGVAVPVSQILKDLREKGYR